MRKKLISVGNSEALVISKELKELTGIRGEVELQVLGNVILIAPAQEYKAGSNTPTRREIINSSVTRILQENVEVLARLKDA